MVSGVDYAICRRVMFIPFMVTIPPAERNTKLSSKLKAEAHDILQ